MNGIPTLVGTYGASTTSVPVSQLNANTTYDFNLVAFSNSATAATAWIAATTMAGPVQAPANFIGTPLSGTQIGFSWSAAANATGYEFYEYENGQPVLIGTFGASTTSTTVSLLQPSTTYAFNVVAFNSTQRAATQWVAVTTTA